MKTRRGGMSVLAMVVACGAALAVVIPAQPVEAGHKPRNDCRPSYPSRSHSYDRHSSRSRVGISLHIGTGGYSKYRGSYYSGYSNSCAPTYYSYSYPRYQYRAYTPAYRYECYDTPRVNTYYNNYSYNTYTYPTPPAGTATYRVWQQDLATPVGQAEPVYPSYNPGPAQPSPAPVAQLERGTEWTTVDLGQQQRQLQQGVTKADRPQTVTIGTRPSVGAATTEQAWGMISSGDYSDARSAFASLTQRDPDSNELKVGYGLSNALEGRDSAAAWSLRRAVESGADLAVAEQVEGLDEVLASVADRLAGKASADSSGDSWFVLGVIQVMRGERDAAGLAVLQGLESGDRSAAILRLAGELGIEVPSDGDA